MASKIIVEICEIDEIQDHNNSDNLELVLVKGWQCIAKIGQYKKGDKVVFIPPDAILPIALADELGVRNYLSGADKNRVKCVRLRGEMSFGLLIDPPEGDFAVGDDLCDYYGITKYEPPVRASQGDTAPSDPYFEKYTDIENIRNYPNIFIEGEKVVVTEKIDGGNLRLNFGKTIDEETGDVSYEWKAGSHNLKRKKPKDEDIDQNTYWFAYNIESVKTMIDTLHNDDQYDCKEIMLFGEVYGVVQGGHKSLNYGKQGSLNFAAFDLMLDGNYVDYDVFKSLCDKFNVPTVPLIGVFDFDFKKMKELSTGNSILAEKNGSQHMREGVVIKPIKERTDPKVGRVVLKLINDDYLILKNKAMDKGEVTDFTDF